MEKWVRKEDETVEVEAVRLNEDNVTRVASWCGAQIVEEIDPEHPEEKQPGLNVNVFGEGAHRASLGMYVVKFAGHFFVYNVRVFEEVYTPKNRDSPPPESPGDTRKRLGFADPFDSFGRRM